MERNTPKPDLYNVPWSVSSFNGMPYRALGRSGLRVSDVGLGTWKFGYPETGDQARVNQQTAFAIFDRAVELGVTFWDTANRYNAASGNSERVIGDWFERNSDQRRNIVVATKIFGGMDGRTPNHSGLSRANIFDSVYASLERLGIDFIDLLYFHSYDPTIDPEESLIAIEDLARQDLVRYFAVSNFTVEQIKKYQALENAVSLRCRIAAVQNQYDILNGENPQYTGVLDFAIQSRISFVAWSPLARGLLTNRYLDASQIGPGDRLFDEHTLEKELPPMKQIKLQKLAAVAAKNELEPSQLVLAYMLTLPGMGPAIPAASSVKQLESNAQAGTVTLSPDIIAEVAAIVA